MADVDNRDHLYAGPPDTRQAATITTSRFRPRYRSLSPAEIALHDAIKAKAAEMEALFEEANRLRCPAQLPPPIDPLQPIDIAAIAYDPAWSYFDEGMKALELAVMWMVKGLTSSPPEAETGGAEAAHG